MELNEYPDCSLERAKERGVTREQVEDVLRTGKPVTAALGRLAKTKIYDYHGIWKHQFYEQQLVKVIYVIEDDTMITVTVIAHYGRWREVL